MAPPGEGRTTLGDVVLNTGDGTGVTAERAISFTALEDTSILLLELGERSNGRGGAVG